VVEIPVSIVLPLAFMLPVCLVIAVLGETFWVENHMSDTTITNASGCRASDSELDRLAASLAALALNYCKPHLNRKDKRVTGSILRFPSLR
jgi:hypothetical protein